MSDFGLSDPLVLELCGVKPQTQMERQIGLERADAVNKALTNLLAEIDRMSESSNDLYRKAFKKVAHKVIEMRARAAF